MNHPLLNFHFTRSYEKLKILQTKPWWKELQSIHKLGKPICSKKGESAAFPRKNSSTLSIKNPTDSDDLSTDHCSPI